MYSGNVITSAPISTSDIGAVVQSSSHDVGTLCKSSNINKWARYKPVSYATTTKLTEDQLRSTNYGLTAKELPNVVTNTNKTFSSSTSISTIIGTPAEWTYKKPSGGSISPYRMGDFLNATNQSTVGYNGNANIPTSGFPEQFDITEEQIDDQSIPLFTFNMKLGEASYESVGQISGVEIPLNKLTILSNSPIDDGNWRVGLAMLVPITSGNIILDIVTSKEPLKQLTSVSQTQDIADMLVDFNQSTTVLNHFNSAFAATSNYTVDIPYVPILMYKPVVASNNGTVSFQTDSRVFCMPGGDQGIIRLYKMDTSFSFTVNAAKIEYLNITGPTTNFVINGITGLRKPSATKSSSCKLTLDFTIRFNVSSVIHFSSMTPGISGSYIEVGNLTYEKYNNGSWQSCTINDLSYAGRYRVTGLDSYTGGGMTDIMAMLDRLPIYTGASGTEPGIGFGIRAKLTSGQIIYITGSGGTTLHMSN